MRVRDGVLDIGAFFPNLSAVRFVYRYVVQVKARFQIISPKLPKSARECLTMRVRDGVSDIGVIFPTLALCVSCTGTWFK